MTENEIKTKLLIMVKKLTRMNWWELSFEQAEQYCKSIAAELGVDNERDQEYLALLTMQYIVENV